MIVLAIAPGIRVLAYAVMLFEEERLRARIVDSKVMHHTGRQYSFDSGPELTKRANVHWLSLQICFERHTPGLIVLGPPAKRSEPAPYVEACRRILRTGALALSLPTIEYQNDREMLEDLGLRQREISGLIQRVLPRCPKNQYALMAIAGGIAGAAQMLELRDDLVSRATESKPEKVKKNVSH